MLRENMLDTLALPADECDGSVSIATSTRYQFFTNDDDSASEGAGSTNVQRAQVDRDPYDDVPSAVPSTATGVGGSKSITTSRTPTLDVIKDLQQSFNKNAAVGAGLHPEPVRSVAGGAAAVPTATGVKAADASASI
uniref:Craniofacial development protein 2 n=1 Tax=Lygus hesperus TaxID=30085 RepID=A0A0A9W1C6_LYGHE